MSLKMSGRIPDIVIGRLPLYLRALTRLQQEGRDVTSSHELGRRLGISSAQIRKDLSHFGGFGKQGTGYQIEFLVEKLRQVLKVNHEWNVAVIGAGDLGSAISKYGGFTERGFRISWLFDVDKKKVGTKIGGIEIFALDKLEDVIKENDCQMAMLAVPAEHAQAVTDRLVKAGVRSILNYAPISLTVPESVMVQYIDPVVHLQHMTYYLQGSED
ncbi:MAG: redox-sensing transcriptional repressor Rex [Anaerolineae bacterium]